MSHPRARAASANALAPSARDYVPLASSVEPTHRTRIAAAARVESRAMRIPVLAALAAAALLAVSPPAHGAATLKVGTQLMTSGGTCLPELVTPSYSQQSAGVEPRAGDVFYLSVRVDFTSSFD